MEKQISFEEAINQLEQLVLKLEQGDVPLEEAISYFQEGMQLSKLCDEKLKNAEQQMTVILGENGELRPFSVGGDEA
ncbi:exodeoxyribonuclease VII small subunit [Ectobacillus ponti]|uniref:Exodeoxyribonuclease 7 small subunit n=1 Tax=Ectobacillus ponti TaxID=2961894 RepID=A0AA42BMW3_9BACI|nr:exodeoxyribonuclease VII small subunit [Ectobacillus ponti]MCP8967047.1 exodeoxyribonuclease VII small subunit [Ectobacillus ponti]